MVDKCKVEKLNFYRARYRFHKNLIFSYLYGGKSSETYEESVHNRTNYRKLIEELLENMSQEERVHVHEIYPLSTA